MSCHSPPARKLRDLVGGCWSSAGSLSKEMDGVVGEGARKWAAALLVKPGHRNIPWRVLKKFKCRGPQTNWILIVGGCGGAQGWASVFVFLTFLS